MRESRISPWGRVTYVFQKVDYLRIPSAHELGNTSEFALEYSLSADKLSAREVQAGYRVSKANSFLNARGVGCMSTQETMIEEQNHRILIIDDNEQIHRDFRKILVETKLSAELNGARTALFGEKCDAPKSVDFELDSAFQGDKGFQMVCEAAQEGRPYAMAFVDVRMPPGWDGVETIKRIWKEEPRLQVVLCTAHSDYSWDEMVDRLGQTDRLVILKKPFDNIEVRQLAAALTEKWRLARQAELRTTELEEMVAQRTASLREANRQLKAEMKKREHAQQEAREKDEQLRHAQRMELTGTLAGGVAHEFNNLLQVMNGYTQYALEAVAPSSDVSRDLEEVLKATNKAASLTSQLLSFSRRQPLRMATVNPQEVLDDLVKLLKPIIGDHIQLEVHTADELGPVRGDPAQLHQALVNLCVNARDAMPNGGRLTIRAEHRMMPNRRELGFSPAPDVKPGLYVVITVSDTGCGMPADVMRRIFDPFFTTKQVGKGTGLGLSMALGTIQEHDGVIDVRSEPGKGSSFSVFLPCETEPSHDIAKEGTMSSENNIHGTETVLVAEDEPGIRHFLVRCLCKAGYVVYEACDGAEAVRVFQEHADEIALLILDVMMPHLTGHDAYRQIRELRPDVRAIFCTGYDPSSQQAVLALEAGVPMIEKPFPRQRLLEVVCSCLDEPEDAAELELCSMSAM